MTDGRFQLSTAQYQAVNYQPLHDIFTIIYSLAEYCSPRAEPTGALRVMKPVLRCGRAKLVPAAMNCLIEADDLEPLDADERLDKVYGLYHIGRDDETRDELALFFDVQLLPETDFLTRRLWSIINGHGGRLCAFSEYSSTEYSEYQRDEFLSANVSFARTSDATSDAALSVAIVELAKPALWSVDTALRPYTAYIGYGDISWPSKFRSVITARQEYV